jgi:hypothetical protein
LVDGKFIFHLTGNIAHIDPTGSTVATRLSIFNIDKIIIIITTGFREPGALNIRTSNAYHRSGKTH